MQPACCNDLLVYPAACCSQALDIFNTAIVSPVYYVMFTVFTIVASIIMFRVSKGGSCGWLAGWLGESRRAVGGTSMSFCEANVVTKAEE
jgi:hypothetical protein